MNFFGLNIYFNQISIKNHQLYCLYWSQILCILFIIKKIIKDNFEQLKLKVSIYLDEFKSNIKIKNNILWYEIKQ